MEKEKYILDKISKMKGLEDFTKKELLSMLKEYDEYIMCEDWDDAPSDFETFVKTDLVNILEGRIADQEEYEAQCVRNYSRG